MEELRKKIVKDINESNLPLDCIYYLMKDLFRDIEAQYANFIQQQEAAQRKETTKNMVEQLTNNQKPNLHVLKNEEKGE